MTTSWQKTANKPENIYWRWVAVKLIRLYTASQIVHVITHITNKLLNLWFTWLHYKHCNDACSELRYTLNLLSVVFVIDTEHKVYCITEVLTVISCWTRAIRLRRWHRLLSRSFLWPLSRFAGHFRIVRLPVIGGSSFCDVTWSRWRHPQLRSH